MSVNSLAPGRFENNFQMSFLNSSWTDTLSNSCETVLRRMPQNLSDDKSTLVQVMAWCRQAPSHYLSQWCPKSLSPYGVTRPQWVNKRGLNVLNAWGLKKCRYFHTTCWNIDYGINYLEFIINLDWNRVERNCMSSCFDIVLVDNHNLSNFWMLNIETKCKDSR